MRELLRKQKGTPIFVYNANDFTLLYIFASRIYITQLISIIKLLMIV